MLQDVYLPYLSQPVYSSLLKDNDNNLLLGNNTYPKYVFSDLQRVNNYLEGQLQKTRKDNKLLLERINTLTSNDISNVKEPEHNTNTLLVVMGNKNIYAQVGSFSYSSLVMGILILMILSALIYIASLYRYRFIPVNINRNQEKRASKYPNRIFNTLKQLLSVKRYKDALLLLEHEFNHNKVDVYSFARFCKLLHKFNLSDWPNYLLAAQFKLDPNSKLYSLLDVSKPVISGQNIASNQSLKHANNLDENIYSDNIDVAKLNLATAYINMGNHEEALEMLHEIIHRGNAEIKEAQIILEQMSEKKMI